MLYYKVGRKQYFTLISFFRIINKEGRITINANTKKPPIGYTNKQWQSDFLTIKSSVAKFNHNHMLDSSCQIIPDRDYADYINNILDNIRVGQSDYCFYVYQVADLLRYEHNLCVDWLEREECFKVRMKYR